MYYLRSDVIRDKYYESHLLTLHGFHMASQCGQFFIRNSLYVFTLFMMAANLNITKIDVHSSSEGTRQIVLIGASVGYSWHFGELSSRINAKPYSFEYVELYKFDKGEALNTVLSRQELPAAIILKECAAYFPGDLDLYKSLMTSWIDQCLEKKVIPIPTTVVPVTWKHNVINGFKIIIKRVIGRIDKIHGLSRIDSILAYNDWIKAYAQSKGLVVLDLEAALRVSPEDRYLRNELTSGDGLHLNEDAYKILDGIVLPTLEKIQWEENEG